MVNTSRAYREAVASGRRDWVEQVTITLADGTVLNITNAQIWSNGLSIEDAVSGDNSFDALGATVINKATIVLNNITDEFSAYDFDKATVRVQVGLQLTQYIVMFDKGYYTVAEPKYDGSLITLECYDYMAKFDRPYSESMLAYPATLLQIVSNACSACGVTLGTTIFPNSTMLIPTKPETDALTFREVIGWCAQIAGCFARMSGDGRLELKWFNGDAVDQESENALDGGVFDKGTPQYTTGDSADGGSFNPWNTGDEYDGGTFDDQQNYHVISAVYNPNVATDDTVITGVKIEVKTSDDSESALAEYTYGTEGYTIGISDNDFITELNAQSIANFLGQRLVGLRFRKATVSHGSDPSIEAGDVALLRTAKGLYVMLITRTVFSSSAAQTTVCASENVARNSATRFTEATKNYVKLREQIVVERSAREQAVAELAEALAESSGLYNTTISAGQVDPSTGQVVTSGNIFFLHDRPLLAESSVVWKMTSDAFGVTNDYQGTSTVWTAGLTVDGNLIANILSAVGVNADWINTGALSVSNGGKEIFYADVDRGIVRMSTPNIYDESVHGNLLENTARPTLTDRPKLRGSNDRLLSYPHSSAFINPNVYPSWYGTTNNKKQLYFYMNPSVSETEESGKLTRGATYTLSGTILSGALFYAGDITKDYAVEARLSFYFGGDDYEIVQRKNLISYPAGGATRRDDEFTQDFSFTFTVDSDDPDFDITSGCMLEIIAEGDGEDVHDPDSFISINKIKLEKGNAATTWIEGADDEITNLDQQWAFNKLTDNGTLQGIFMENGQLYINMSYLKSGTIIVGGANDQNGVLEIRNSSNTRIGRWDKDALYIGNVSSALSSPNTKIDTNGAITTKSLTANDYLYVNGNGNSTFQVPTSTSSPTTYYVHISKTGFAVRYGSNGLCLDSRGMYIAPFSNFGGSGNITGQNTQFHGSSIRLYANGNSSNNTWMTPTSFAVRNASGATISNVSTAGISTTGSKPRRVATADYGDRYLFAYETPTPMFGDIGDGKIGEDGKCYVQIDNVFAETVSLSQYQVFLQKYGEGECWVSERNSAYFVVEGTAGLSFGWEIKAKQSDFDQLRLTQQVDDVTGLFPVEDPDKIDYGAELIGHIITLQNEREVLPA